MTILSEVRYKDGYIEILQKMLNQSTDMKYQVLKLRGLKYILKYKIQIIFVIISIV